MKVVVDTNVMVSGLLAPYGPGGEIVRMVSAGHLSLCYDARILAEYAEVLVRPKFPFEPHLVETLLAQIREGGTVVAAVPLQLRLPDPDDEMFLQAALAGGAECLITGNLRHYPPAKRQGVTVVTPAEFVQRHWKPGPR
jgi:putative PIN family toxin of toxin-antitoxin system